MMPPAITAFFAKWGMALIGLALALIATFYAGKMQERAGWESRRADQVQAARETERSGVDIANTAGADHSAELKQQLEKAHAELENLRAALPTVPDCAVPRRVVRLLDGQRVPRAAGSPGKPAQPTAPVGTDGRSAPLIPGLSALPRVLPRPEGGREITGADAQGSIQCSAVIEHCAVNRVTVCEPNALQLEAVQQFYENLKRKYNRQP